MECDFLYKADGPSSGFRVQSTLHGHAKFLNASRTLQQLPKGGPQEKLHTTFNLIITNVMLKPS